MNRLWLGCLLLLSGVIPATAQSGLERLIERGYRIIEGDTSKHRERFFFALPIWDVAPETGIKLGLSTGFIFRLNKTDKRTRPSLIRLNTSYTQNGQFNIRPNLELFTPGNRYHVKAQFVYNDFNERYWGVGNKVTDPFEVYRFKQQKVNLRLMRQWFPGWYAGAQLQYERIYQVRFPDSSAFPASGAKGINGYEVLGLGLAVAFDNRDNIYYPSKGVYLEVSNLMHSSSLAGNHSYHAITSDFRTYHALTKGSVLALQFMGVFNDGNVPYRQMGTMGNEMIMRGYYNGRYRDQNFAALQAEWRQHVWGPAGFTLFAGAGNVAATPGNLTTGIKPNYGVGLRGLLIRKEHLNIRLDIGFGEKGIRGLYFTMGEAF